MIVMAAPLPDATQQVLAMYCAICHDSITIGDPVALVHAERGEWQTPGEQETIHAHCTVRAVAALGTRWAIVIDRWGRVHV